jgi:hypothetical protein
MLYKFKSQAAPDVVMLESIAKRVLEIIGKDVSGAGIVTVEQIPAAMAALKQAVALDDAAQQAEPHVGEDPIDHGLVNGDPISLRQRVWPLVDMLQRSHAEGKPVTW